VTIIVGGTRASTSEYLGETSSGKPVYMQEADGSVPTKVITLK